MTWLTRILPYVEQGSLWQTTVEAYASQSSPFLNPPHVGLTTPLLTFTCPLDSRVFTPQTTPDNDRIALTSYLGVLGTDYSRLDGVLFLDSRVRLADITDGASQTLLVGERPPSSDFRYGWWYAGDGEAVSGAGDMLLGVREQNVRDDDAVTNCPVGPYHFQAGSFDQQCDMFHFWSPHSGGGHFLFVDGSVHFLPYSADPHMPALATRAGGEIVSSLD